MSKFDFSRQNNAIRATALFCVQCFVTERPIFMIENKNNHYSLYREFEPRSFELPMEILFAFKISNHDDAFLVAQAFLDGMQSASETILDSLEQALR